MIKYKMPHHHKSKRKTPKGRAGKSVTAKAFLKSMDELEKVIQSPAKIDHLLNSPKSPESKSMNILMGDGLGSISSIMREMKYLEEENNKLNKELTKMEKSMKECLKLSKQGDIDKIQKCLRKGLK